MSSLRRRRALLATPLIAAAVTAATPAVAADRASQSPKQILKSARTDLAKVKSLHIAGTSATRTGP